MTIGMISLDEKEKAKRIAIQFKILMKNNSEIQKNALSVIIMRRIYICIESARELAKTHE